MRNKWIWFSGITLTSLILALAVRERLSDSVFASTFVHSADVVAADISPDAKTLVVSDYDCSLTFWNTETGERTRTLKLCTDRHGVNTIRVLRFSPSGDRILIDGYAGERHPQIIRADTGASVVQLETDLGLWRAEWSADGTRIVTTSGSHNAQLWDAASGAKLLDLTGHTARVNGVDFSPQGDRVVTSSDDGTARIWSTLTGKAELQLHHEYVVSASFSASGSTVATAGYDRTARLWDARNGVQLRSYEMQGWVTNAFLSANDEVLVASVWFYDEVIVRDVDTGSIVTKFSHGLPQHQHLMFVEACCQSSGIFTGAGNEVKIWHLEFDK